MKSIYKFSVAILIAASLLSSCNGAGEKKDSELTKEEKAVINNYVDDVIITSYTQLATDGKAMLTNIKAIAASTDADKTSLIAKAAESWRNARISWERTEAYLFGPVDKAGIDPGIDSWPLVLPDLQKSIQNWDPSKHSYKDLSADGGDLKGFHAIEYLLFANGKPKTKSIADFDSMYALDKGSLTDAQFQANLENYLVAVAEELYRCVLQLETEWSQEALSAVKKSDLAAFGNDIKLNTPNGNYGELMKTPGLENDYYQSFKKSIDEMFVGAIGIADEVANVKISDPISAEET